MIGAGIGLALAVCVANAFAIVLQAAEDRQAPLSRGGLAALAVYAHARLWPRTGLALVVGAGLAYAWVDFTNELLADDISHRHWAYAIAWTAGIAGFGAVAFLQETSALQRRPAVTVEPVITAVHQPLPVLMAVWAGIEVWGSTPPVLAALFAGLAAIATGAVVIGRSSAIARVSHAAA